MLHRIPWKPFRRALALEAAERWMSERISDGSDWPGHGLPLPMLNSLIALHALGSPNSHPVPWHRRKRIFARIVR